MGLDFIMYVCSREAVKFTVKTILLPKYVFYIVSCHITHPKLFKMPWGPGKNAVNKLVVLSIFARHTAGGTQ